MKHWCAQKRANLVGYFVVVLVGLFLAYRVYTRDYSHMFPTSFLDLGIHELGHILTRFLGNAISIPMGTVAQWALPTFVVWKFLNQREYIGVGFSLLWLAHSITYSQWYCQDAARGVTHEIQGRDIFGGEWIHDYYYMLTHTGLITHANSLSFLMWSVALCIATLAVVMFGFLIFWMIKPQVEIKELGL